MPLNGIIGIISCGGLSSRMKTDKSLLQYYHKPHRYYLYDLLKSITGEAYLSCNQNQVEGIDSAYNYIVDNPAFVNHGPVSGLLSAFELVREKAILMIGCDYPYVTENSINHLINSREEKFLAVAFKNNFEDFAEPLITIYEFEAYPFILERFHQQKYSLREFLEQGNSKFIYTENENLFKSIDTPEQYQDQLRIKK